MIAPLEPIGHSNGELDVREELSSRSLNLIAKSARASRAARRSDFTRKTDSIQRELTKHVSKVGGKIQRVPGLADSPVGTRFLYQPFELVFGCPRVQDESGLLSS